MPLSEHDRLDDMIERLPPDWIGSPIANLKSIPWARTKLFGVALLGSIIGMIAVYYTEKPLTFVFSLLGLICFVSMLFLILFGVTHRESR